MVVGLDDAVGGAALAGHVAVEREIMLVGYVLFWSFASECVPLQYPVCPGFFLVARQRSQSSGAVDFFSILALSDYIGSISLAWDRGGIADCMRPRRHRAQGILGLGERV